MARAKRKKAGKSGEESRMNGAGIAASAPRANNAATSAPREYARSLIPSVSRKPGAFLFLSMNCNRGR